jgi:hypothetical protein
MPIFLWALLAGTILLKAISFISSSPLFSGALALGGSLLSWADGDTLREEVSCRHEHRSRVGRELLPGQLGNPSDDGGTPSTVECLRVLNAREEAQDGVLKA